jgi:hypothetical protein
VFWIGWEIEILMGFGWIWRSLNGELVGCSMVKPPAKTPRNWDIPEPSGVTWRDVVLIAMIHRTWDIYHRYMTYITCREMWCSVIFLDVLETNWWWIWFIQCLWQHSYDQH